MNTGFMPNDSVMYVSTLVIMATYVSAVCQAWDLTHTQFIPIQLHYLRDYGG